MAEHEPPASRPFDPEAVGKTLRTAPAPVADVAYGHGQQFLLRDGRTRLEVFPDTSVTRLTGADIRVELFRAPVPSVQGEEVVVALGQRDDTGYEATVSLLPDGGVIFTYVTAATESPRPAERNPADVTAPERRSSPPAGPPAAVARVDGSEPGSSAPGRDTPATREAEERVQLTGRLGRDPSFYTTARGIRVAKFPLAIEQEGGKAAWHDVLAFGDYAETLRASIERGEQWLRKGRPVQVVGYWHENQKPTKDGTVRTVHDLYAAAVRQTPPIGTRT